MCVSGAFAWFVLVQKNVQVSCLDTTLCPPLTVARGKDQTRQRAVERTRVYRNGNRLSAAVIAGALRLKDLGFVCGVDYKAYLVALQRLCLQVRVEGAPWLGHE